MPARVHAFMSAYYYPPAPSVGVLRNEALATLLAERGYILDVVTGPWSSGCSQLRLNGAAVRRLKLFDYRTLTGGAKGNFAPPAKLKRGIAYDTFRALSNGFPTNLLFGEGGISYIVGAYAHLAGRIAATGGCGLLYSSFRPWADHQIAYLLKRKFPNLLWWQDWRDTAYETRRDRTYFKSFQQDIVGKLIRKADLITAVSNGVARDLSQHGREIDTLYNGATTRHVVPARATKLPRICYTGSLYGEDRDPRPLFRALKAISEYYPNFEIVYAGKDGAQWLSLGGFFDLGEMNRSMGLVSREDSFALQKSAAVNVLLTWANPGQGGGLTMKLFEYLQAGQPILRIHDGPPDPEIDTLLASSSGIHFTYSKQRPDPIGLSNWLVGRLKNYQVLPQQPGFDMKTRLNEYLLDKVESGFPRH